MSGTFTRWWDRLAVQRKIFSILLLVFVPLAALLAVQVAQLSLLVTLQQQHHQVVLAREQIQILRRLAIDIEDGFRGYLLTGQERFLKPLTEAEDRLRPTVARTMALLEGVPAVSADLRVLGERVRDLVGSKHALIEQYRTGQRDEVFRYVASGKGLQLSDGLRDEIRLIEDRLERSLQSFEFDQAALARRSLWGLVVGLFVTLLAGVIGARLLTRSILRPLATVQEAVTALDQRADTDPALEDLPITSFDEIGRMARGYYEALLQRVRQHVRELEAINAIGQEINTIGPDGLDGVLRRITERAAELMRADVCLVLLRNEAMGCWVIEAASGEWNERLRKAVMLWEEFPVSVEAFETGQPSIVEHAGDDPLPHVLRRALRAESRLAIPLRSHGVSFGVLVFFVARPVPRGAWNVRLAREFADDAAIAIANARSYEKVQAKEKGLEQKLQHLEHLAETLAHDLKSPGERMGGLATVLLAEYSDRLDERAGRWLRLIEENGRRLTERVENILAVARLGARPEAVQSVDPVAVIQQVIKDRGIELEARQARLVVDGPMPAVACHCAYLLQVFDNLLSNAVKFARQGVPPEVRFSARREGERVLFSVRDNGIGVPADRREQAFEPFVRLHPEVAKGSGIGLAIVKRIVEQYGGRAWLESHEGPGCMVCFTMPAVGISAAGPLAGPVASVPGPAEEVDRLVKGSTRHG